MKNIIKALTLISSSIFALTASANTASEHDNAHHFPSVFIGSTTTEGETEFTYGVEYEYKFNHLIGTGVVYERRDHPHHGTGAEVYLASIYLHPWKTLRVGAGYGAERMKGSHGYREELVRISLSYDFHFAGITIAPTIASDFVHGETTTVMGLAFGYVF